MEGAAIAQVCKLDNVPFIVIRGISDSPQKISPEAIVPIIALNLLLSIFFIAFSMFITSSLSDLLLLLMKN